MEKKIAVIGHVDHGKTTMTAALHHLISKMDDDVVIIEDGKIVHGEIPKMTRHELKLLEIPELPQLTAIDYGNNPVYKPKKPNSGLTIGSYKLKSKKR